MARRDGMPTNRELQVEFTSDARDLFVAATERELESKIGLRPAFEGKALGHIVLSFALDHRIEEHAPQAVRKEVLRINPLSYPDVNDLKYEQDERGYKIAGNEIFRDVDESVLEHYEMLAKIIGGTSITDELRFGQIPKNGVVADWTAYLEDRTRHAGTFKERPSKQSLVSAKFFVDDARQYVNSDLFEKDTRTRISDVLHGFEKPESLSGMRHWFSFLMSPELDINGHESHSFLEAYADHMTSRLEYAAAMLDHRTSLGAPAVITEHLRERVDLYQKAVDKVTPHLQK